MTINSNPFRYSDSRDRYLLPGPGDFAQLDTALEKLIAERSKQPDWLQAAMDQICCYGQHIPTYKRMVQAMLDGDFTEVGKLYCSMADIELAERAELDLKAWREEASNNP